MLKLNQWTLTVALALTLALPAAATAQTYKVKIATLAPSNSVWMHTFKAAAREIKKKTNGKVRTIIYGNGALGDENTMVRKMRSGSIQGAAITSVGLAQIAPDVLVLQAPRLIRTYKQLDYVRNHLKARLEKAFLDKGFVLLGWGDVGATHIFSKSRIESPSDLKNVKPWVWNTDPVFKSLYRKVGAHPVPLGVPKVLGSLSSGMINAYYGSPLVAIALQWFKYSKYVLRVPINIGVGATVVSKKSWDLLPAEYQKVVRDVSAKWHRILIHKVRKDNKKAEKALLKLGYQFVTPSPSAQREWNSLGLQVTKSLVGKVYSKDILVQVARLLKSAK